MKILFLDDSEADERNVRRGKLDSLIYPDKSALGFLRALLPHEAHLGPVVMASLAEQLGHEVSIFEMALHPAFAGALEAKLRAADYDLVCVSTTFIMVPGSVEKLVKKVRQLSPGSRIVLGGASLMESAPMREMGDFAILGPGELPFEEFLRSLGAGAGPAELRGVHKSGSSAAAPRYDAKMDLSPAPNWSLLRRRKDEFYLLETQRGCPWRCQFCSYPGQAGNKLAFRSVEGVLAELKHNYDRFGISRYMFADSTFNYPKQRCLEILRKLAELPFPIEWVAYARIDSLTEEMVELMVRAGCQGLLIGLESGDDGMLTRMRKGFDRASILRGAEFLKGAGILRAASWVVDFPGETEESVANTSALIRELGFELNSLSLFQVQEMSPIAKAKERPESKPDRGYEYISRIVSESRKAGITLGSSFDLFRFCTAGISLKDAYRIFRASQSLEPSVRASVRPDLERLKESGMSHPLYRSLAPALERQSS